MEPQFMKVHKPKEKLNRLSELLGHKHMRILHGGTNELLPLRQTAKEIPLSDNEPI